MNRKKFTVAELISVICLLLVLVAMIVPSVSKFMNIMEEKSFVSTAQDIYKIALETYEDNYKKNNLDNKRVYCHNDNDNRNQLNLNRENVNYKVLFDEYGNLTYFIVFDDNYMINANGKSLKIDMLDSDIISKYDNKIDMNCN